MIKQKFNKLPLSGQVNYFNRKLQAGSRLNQICKDLKISPTTIRERFKKHNFIYNRLGRQYQELNLSIDLSNYKKIDSELILRSVRLSHSIIKSVSEWCEEYSISKQDFINTALYETLIKYKQIQNG